MLGRQRAGATRANSAVRPTDFSRNTVSECWWSQCQPTPKRLRYSMSMAHAGCQHCQMQSEHNRHECAIYGKSCMWAHYVIVVFVLISRTCGRLRFFQLSAPVDHFYDRVHLIVRHFFVFAERSRRYLSVCNSNKRCTYSTEWRQWFVWSNRSRLGSEIIVRGIFCFEQFI